MADDVTLNAGSGGATLAADDIGGIHHQRVKIQQGADGSATDVSPASPLPAEPIMDSAQSTYATSASLSPGGSVDLDSAQINSGKTGELVGILLCAAAPLKAELKTVTNGVASATLAVFFVGAGNTETWQPPSRKFFRIAQDVTAGLDGFRVSVTNQDTGSQATDVHGTFFYDEV